MKLILPFIASVVLSLSAAARVSEKFTHTYPLDPAGSIHIENINGSIEIVAWDRPEVALEAEKTARNEEALARVSWNIEATATRLRIKTEHEKKWNFWATANAEVHYKLKVPAGASLDKIDVVNSDIRVRGIRGPVDLDAVNGSIDAQDLAGGGRFDTVNGSITVAYASVPASATISLGTVNGRCKLALPADAAFDLEADTVNGRVTCDFPITLSKSGRSELRGSVNGGGTRVKLDSVNGGLTVAKQ